MAGESIRDYGNWVDLETNGALIANNAFGAADDAGMNLATQGGSRPHLEFELEFTMSASASAGAVALHHAAHNLFGSTAADGQNPSATNIAGWLRSIQIATGSTAVQRFRFDVMFAPSDSLYWLQNVGTGQSIALGWKLRARAWSLKASPT